MSSISEQTFIYLDPPYLLSTRRSGPIYEHELTEADHLKLLRMIKKLDCMVMISGYQSPMYARELSGWYRQSYLSQTRGGFSALEILWMNYPPPTALHDYAFLGEDYRERERIKRKIKRWADRLKSLPPLERAAILEALNE